MTMLTHRATPSCLPQRKSLTFEEQMAKAANIRRMKETAKLENKVAGLMATPNYTRPSSARRDPNSLYARIYRAVRDNGPILVCDLVDIVQVKPRQVYNVVNKAKELAAREGYRWHVEDVRFPGNKTKRRYWLEVAE